MADSIIANALKNGIDSPKYEGFDACAYLTFDILNGEKDKLIRKISSGEYLSSEEQYFLARLDTIMKINLKGWLYSHPFILYTTIVDFWKGG